VAPEERKTAIELVQEAHAKGARKYKACELIGVALRTLERWEKEGAIDRRKGAERNVGNKLTEQEKDMILMTVNSLEYCDFPPCQIVPRLADKGIYIASESSIYRILREKKQLAHRGQTAPRKHKRPMSHEATGPNQLWSWDITYLPSQVQGLYFYLYLIMDVFSRKIVGWSIHERQDSEHAAHLIHQACLDEKVHPKQLILHSDNGSPMKGVTMLAMLENLGVVPSFSRPSVSDDNPYSESLFKTLKYHPSFPLTTKFERIFDARTWTIKFVEWYNTAHLHSGLKFITPAQRHMREDLAIMKKRQSVYQRAKESHPERWSTTTRNWELPTTVTLNANRKNRKNATPEKKLDQLVA
jgi:putative transposase